MKKPPNKKGPDPTPTVSRVLEDGTIIELLYSAEKKRTSLVIAEAGADWRYENGFLTPAGEKLVPYSAHNNLIANECVLLPSEVTDHGDKDQLREDVRAFLHRYTDLSPEFETIASYYILLTWVYDAFNEVPYLRFRGDYGTGKTRSLMTIGSLCYKSFFASGASTVSPIFHTLNSFGGTLVLDEADLRFSDAKADVVKILNNGNVKGMPVLRTIINRAKEFNPQAFHVFGPKIVAMRHSFDDRALESRFLTEETGQRTLRDDIPVYLPNSLKEEAVLLRNKLLHFRLTYRNVVKVDPGVIVAEIEPRLNQTALSLLSLIDDAETRKSIGVMLLRLQEDIVNERGQTLPAQVLQVVAEAFAGDDRTAVSIREIADSFNSRFGQDYDRTLPNRTIGIVLRKHLRLKTQKSNGIYVVSVSELPKIDVLVKRLGVVLPERDEASRPSSR
jgi:hypothetical protein